MNAAELLKWAIQASIMLTVFGIGLAATWQDATSLVRQPGLLIRSLLSMNVVMPIVAATVAAMLDLPEAVKIALVALFISPVPPILPKKEFKAGGHASYAVGLLLVIGVIAIAFVPIALEILDRIFQRSAAISPLTVAKIVLASILVPMLLGILVRHWRPDFAQKASPRVVRIGFLLLVLAALPIVFASWRAIHALVGNGTVLILAFVAVAGLAVGHWLGGPDADDRSVLALSTATRHPAIALAIATSGSAEMKAELAAIMLYFLVATAISIPYVQWRRRNAARAQAAT